MSLEITQESLQEVIQGAITAALQASQPRENTTTHPHIKRAERPDVDVGCSESQWLFFLDEWKSYKRRTTLDATKVVDELRASCTKELRRILFEFVGGSTLETISEND